MYIRHLIAGAAISASWAGMAVAEDCALRVTTWGGSYQATYQAVAQKFEEEHNCRIEWVVGASPDHLIKARLGQVDVVTNTLLNSIAGEKEGLWQKLDPAKIPNMANLYPNAVHSPYTVFANVGDYVLAYNKDTVTTVPATWDELWKPEYKNRVVIYGIDHIPTLSLTVLQAEKNGGSIDNVEPGLDRMAELIKSGNLIGSLDVESQMVSLFETGDAWLGMLATGRMKELLSKGVTNVSFVRPEEGTFPLITSVNIHKDAKNPAMAAAFVNYILSSEVQVAFATRNLYAPTVKNAEIPDDFEFRDLLVLNDAFGRLYLPDQEKITANKAGWQQQLNQKAMR
ncbi:ABC transporter substrate-binding protein [Sinorhizobium meliloti]|uniref:ABC transporter, periplasmic solute-binding protein n=3 Tax=Rhizobium meliloti TaxID=382 RepID=Q92XQ2_RHIME|nr:ABC transporter substrate-binding protein [Sinorhizobium meliloti]TWB00347.1 putative spermidine/putrescine transport system substrate-binding protein [Ensifer sp. SEMIA 134]TWB35102.1 putative spermidine/putrescine transport system substrate-binding protein [Ensifer sp. SEMIA 135]AAK65850.1 ABC transporter, periplasmic solute-binding protein [Sinorhizobium meliloti 1021]ASP60996.1 ABC transporter substrate-binding protein [Sinorhizobium meliloti]MCK3803721.1 ABC transporter substrate-bindi